MTMQTKPRELNKIEFRTLQFPCDLRPGSAFSTELLNALSDSKNKELFRSDMKLVLEFKWDQLKNMVFLQNFELFAYVVFLLLCKTDVILAPLALLIFTVIIAVPEAFQLRTSIATLAGRNKDDSTVDFDDLQNLIEFSGYLMQIVFNVVIMKKHGYFGKDLTVDKSTLSWALNLNLISCGLIFFRAFFILRAFQPLRALIRMIKAVIADLVPFTILLFTACYFFAVHQYLMNEYTYDLAKENNEKGAKLIAFYKILEDQVALLATGQYGIDIGSTAAFFMYFLAFYFNVIIMLNLLIAIISEKFSIVLEQTVPMDCMERAKLLLEIEGFVGLFRGCIPSLSDGREQFLHFCRYKSDQEDEDDANIDVEGRMRVMNVKVAKIRDMQAKGSNDLLKLQTEMESEVGAKMGNVMRVLQHVQKKME